MNDKNIRVRFAPSPTGFLHVGGARTAMFNWMWARHTGGTFVLRIEDTDEARSTRESEQTLIEDLRWLGLDWDEGPGAARGSDGPYAPYRQSERTEVYRDVAQQFVMAGRAYPCFCTDDELERKREIAIVENRPPQYDGTCSRLATAEVSEKRALKIPEVVRFRVGDGVVRFKDVVRGNMELGHDMVGDFVILRSNGLPTYNFAAAVDDHHMKITHVIRGEEHLSNTLRQVLVYDALGATHPVFAHVPLILAEDRSKLSKRHGAASVDDLRRQGFLSGAVFNYLVLLGWSHPQGKEILSREELVAVFDIDRIGKAAGVFDRQKLIWMNGQYMRAMSFDEFVPLAEPFLPEAIKQRHPGAARREVLSILQDSIGTLEDLQRAALIFADTVNLDDEAHTLLATEGARGVIAAFRDLVIADKGDFTPDVVKGLIKEAGTSTGTKGRDLYFPIRAALTGSVHGPDLMRVAAVKGKESVVKLLEVSIR